MACPDQTCNGCGGRWHGFGLCPTLHQEAILAISPKEECDCTYAFMAEVTSGELQVGHLNGRGLIGWLGIFHGSVTAERRVTCHFPLKTWPTTAGATSSCRLPLEILFRLRDVVIIVSLFDLALRWYRLGSLMLLTCTATWLPSVVACGFDHTRSRVNGAQRQH